MRTTGFSLSSLLHEIALYLGASPWSLWHQLDDLRALDDHLLRDIGLSRADAIRGGLGQDSGEHTMLLFVTSSLGRGV
jgi:phosphinothricin acetyltransferase